MKKLTLLLALLTLAFVGCSSEKKQEQLPAKNVVRIQTLNLQNPAKAQEDLLAIAKAGAFNLRAKTADLFYILGVENEKATFRILTTRGEDQYLGETKLSATDLKKFLSTPNSKISFKDATLTSKAAFTYKMLKDGAIEANLPIEFKQKKDIKTFDLALIVNIESFNALNFWDGNPTNTPKEQMYIYDFLSPEFSDWYDPKVQKSKVDAVIKATRLAGLPEVIGMQEAEYAQGNNEHFKPGSYFRTEMEKLGYKTFILGAQEENNPVALTTAFISRYPLKDLKNIPFNVDHPYFNKFTRSEKYGLKFNTRDIQVAELDLNGDKIRLYNNHWRSQGCSDNDSCERSEEVRKITARVLHDALVKARQENPAVGIVVLGDMNTEYYTDILKSMNNTGNEKIVQDDLQEDFFYNLWYELPVEKRWDASNGGFTSTLSHMQLNTNMYGNRGLQYIDRSFFALGQEGVAKEILINADGNPFRFQEMKYKAEQTTGEINKLLTQTMNERECYGKRSKARNCRISYTTYAGMGFSDHLSIQAAFRYVGHNFADVAKTNFSELNTAETTKDPEIELVIEPCPLMTFAPYPNALQKDFHDAKLLRQCFRVESEKALPLKNEGLFNTAYVETPYGKLGISMMRSFDPRGIKGDKMLPVPDGEKMHPLSNQCFQRKVLQSPGGSIKKAIGRLGYNNGILSIFIDKREDIEFGELPKDKLEACR